MREQVFKSSPQIGYLGYVNWPVGTPKTGAESYFILTSPNITPSLCELRSAIVA